MAGDSGTDAGPQEALPPTWAVENASVIRSGTQIVGAQIDGERVAVDDPRLRTITRSPGKPSLRRGALAQHVDLTVGQPGTDSLTSDGIEAHRVSADLNEVARANTLDKSRRRSSVGRKIRRVGVFVVALVFIASLVWIGGNVAGYFMSTSSERDVTTGERFQSSVVVDGAVEKADCFSPGAQEVWEAAPPFNSVVPYRCGETPLSIAVPGPISAGVAGLAVLSLGMLIVAVRRRRRRNFWY